MTVGDAFTVIACVAVAVQPLAAVPVTVYVVVEAGVTVTGVPFSDPGIQLYVDAPLEESVVEFPEHIVGEPALAVTVGLVFTVISCVAMDEHPPVVPVTVYVVVAAGETVTGLPGKDPGIQLYEVAPDAVSVAELPEQMVAVEVETVTVGVGLTVISRVAVPVQPLAAVPVTV